MKKLLLGVCAISLLNGVLVMPVTAGITEFLVGRETRESLADTSRAQAFDTSKDLPESNPEATPVEHTAGGADYSSDAGDSAAMVDMALSTPLTGMAVGWPIQQLKQYLPSWKMSQTLTTTAQAPIHAESAWVGLGITLDGLSGVSQLGHAAVNQFMRDSTKITADFAGVQGHVTDKWIGPADRNLIVAIMDKLGIDPTRLQAVSFDKDMYQNLQDASSASPRELMEYRRNELLEDQRSLQNVAKEQRAIRYRAQQRSIKAMASAMELKRQLSSLAEMDAKIQAQYNSKNQALNTLATRRALYDSLMLLKMNVLAVRTKVRAETLELDFKPLKKELEIVGNDNRPEFSAGGGQ